MNRLFVDHLTVLDFSYLHPTRGIVGESWILDIELAGKLDEQGMVFDFGDVKKVLRDAAEDLIDHKLVIPEEIDGLEVNNDGDRIEVALNLQSNGRIECKCPTSAITLLPTNEITIDEIQPILNKHLQSVVPKNVKSVKVTLREELIQGAYYHYTHGLKKHGGNCQRIAHGHRSKLEIFTDGQRSQLIEYQWAKKWKDIYLGSKADVVKEESYQGTAHVRFGYEAQQGSFELLVPKHSTYLIDTDTTVEWIAEHIAQTLKQQRPQNVFLVRCYEGVKKGAIAER
ncbi:6-pyruvoyl tetrahydropterin reductase [Hahella sp. CCB-MM4]|uniref:6-pyruvoyl trahydropterin synthase family protein n=1 Tax=Hahella sp. (strain CCB-MM4) TaxID=1926491 RepID=UPI000B9A851C|nr:6-carboxytetrahydropterin synthase [Hahella sp. CCB-MM4]OZG71322.1 6-pyruvoyl tetrahydropterin reductase [Hahella sp. CCB-MM4]